MKFRINYFFYYNKFNMKITLKANSKLKCILHNTNQIASKVLDTN